MLKNLMKQIDFQKQAMDVSSLRHDVISDNIANVETPNYKRKQVIFESILEEKLDDTKFPIARTHKMHYGIERPTSSYYVKIDKSYSNRIDKNNVNIDVEMANQAKNQITYSALVNQLSGQIVRMKLAIKGGR